MNGSYGPVEFAGVSDGSLGRSATFPVEWGDPPADEESRSAWILSHCRRDTNPQAVQEAQPVSPVMASRELRRRYSPAREPAPIPTTSPVQARESLRRRAVV